jgi:MFS family permease
VRFYHGFATAIFGTAASAAIAERYRADRAARLSAYSSVTHAGRSVAPFLGGTLISLASYDAVYIACAISGVLALAVGLLLNGVAPAPAEKPQSPHFRAQCYSLSPKTVRPEPVEGQPFDRLRANGAKRIRQIEPYYFRAGLASVLRDRGIMRVSLIEAAQYLVFGAVEAFLALYAAALGIPAWQIGGVLGVQLLSIVFTKPLMGRVSDRVGRRQVILPGLVIGAASVALLPLASGFIGLAGLSLLFGLGFATVTSSTTALVADLTRDGRFGSSMGVLRSVMDVGQSIGPVLTGYVVGSAGYGAAFMLLAAILLLATLLLVRSDSLSRPPAGP